MINALTVDLEDWYHICGCKEYANSERWESFESRVTENTEKILRLLRSFNVNATFFVLGYLAEREPDLVKYIDREGHEIATHSYSHQRLFELTPTEFEDDLCKSKEIIEGITKRPVKGFRAPEWSIRSNSFWALDILRKNGIIYDSSMAPLTRMGERSFPHLPVNLETQYGNIAEFPLTTSRCLWERIPFTGGQSLRIAPYWFILHSILSTNRKGYPCIVYLHPWEFDNRRPAVNLPFIRRFTHYFRIRSAAPKIEGLLRHLQFAPVIEVLRNVNLV